MSGPSERRLRNMASQVKTGIAERDAIPYDDRYRSGSGKMDAYLPGGSKYEGALYGGEPKATGPVKKKRGKGKAQ